MANTIFFSWQADTPTTTGRNLIERALEGAAARIGADTQIEDAVRELEIDRDTKGVAGSPPIVDTIFRKIDQAVVFVPDLTFVGKRLDGRPTPNPNVLVEYGWALKSLTHSRIVPVMNTAFGEPTAESMPFDMAHLRRPILYSCPSSADQDTRRKGRDALSKSLELAIRAVLTSEEFAAGLLQPKDPTPFVLQAAKDGLGRFRNKGEPIGIVEGAGFRGTIDVQLSEGPATWFRMMPLTQSGRVFSSSELISAMDDSGMLMPLFNGLGGYSRIRAHDGVGVFWSSGEGETSDIVFIFKTGEIWSIDSHIIKARQESNSIQLSEREFTSALKRFGGYLGRLGINPPYRWIAGMEGIRGRGMFVPSRDGYYPYNNQPSGRCMLDSVTVDGIFDPNEDTEKSLEPFFVRVYEICGLDRPAWLSNR